MLVLARGASGLVRRVRRGLAPARPKLTPPHPTALRSTLLHQPRRVKHTEISKERKQLARERRRQWSRASSAQSQGSDWSRPSTSGAIGAIDRLLAASGQGEGDREQEHPFGSSELPSSRQWAGIFTPNRGTRLRSRSRGGGGGGGGGASLSVSGRRPRSRALAVALSNLYEGDQDGGVVITEANMQEMWRFSQLSTPERPSTSVRSLRKT